MKPSISIDLPGWCTLKNRDKPELGREESALEDTPGSTGIQDLDDRGSSSAGNGNGNGEESDDDDDAIARLFSIGGVKRRKTSYPHQLASGRDSGIKNGSGGRARRGSAGFELQAQAEAFLDWPCVRCTFINAYTEDACGGCGGGNVKRARLLRERREEVERLGRLRSAREYRDRSLKEEAFKDLLEDSGDSDDDNDNDDDDANSNTPAGHTSPTTAVAATTAAAAAAAAAAPSVDKSSSAPSAPNPKRDRNQACVIGALPPDLLLQCAEYLGDARTLCRVREVCHGWVVTLDDREAGQRLWRPLFYRLRASGCIHKATDATGQRHRQLKVYDLGTTTAAAAAATATPPSSRSGGTAAALDGKGPATGVPLSAATPSPSQPRSATLPAGCSSASAGKSPGPSATQPFACVVCRLIQREGYSGRDCEMCASSLVPVRGRGSPAPAAAPATPRLAYTRVNLSGAAVGPSPSNVPPLSSPSQPQQQRGGRPRSGSWSGPPPNVGRSQDNGSGGGTADMKGDTAVSESAGAGAARDGVAGGSSGVRGREEEEELGDGARSIDWHFLVKRLAEEKRIAGAWGSLHHGWVWLQRALQNMLRRRRGHQPLGATPSSAASSSGAGYPQADPRAISADSRGGGRGAAGPSQLGARQQQQPQQMNTPAAGRQAGDGELDPTIARLVRKLASKKWVLLYDSLKATFTLQAEGIAREVVFEAMAAAADAAARDALGDRKADGVGARERRGAAAAELEGLRSCVAAWEAYKDWCEEVDMYCELLNEQISAERYRTAGAGCGRGDNTPYIRDTALVSFRHSFALNVQICAMLRSSISKGMPTAALGAADSEPRRKASRHEAESETVNTAARGGGFSSRDTVHSAAGGQAVAAAAAAPAGDAEELFTDLELMEDSRAIDFSVRTFSGPSVSGGGGGGGGGGGCGGAAGRAGGKGAAGSGACGSGGGSTSKGGRALANTTTVFGRSLRGSSGSSRPGNYYDWFLSKLEGKEMGIIRGDIDARGKSVRGGDAGAGGGAADGEGGGDDGGGLQTATLSELLEMVHDMVEELDVPDDGLSKDRHTQGAMRRLLFLPIKRWQAAVAEANTAEEDPRNLLLAGLSPAPGEGGFHRLRGGAAGRRKGTPPMSSLKKDAGKSWEHLSTLFG